MFERLPVLIQSAMYSLRGGFLIRPLVIAIILGAVGAVFSSVEEAVPQIDAWIPTILFPSREDPGVAQVILSSIATSIMTIVSIVFAILLMTLTLASTQFSPRILISFVRDRTTQWTLGVFLGTFSYCMADPRVASARGRHRPTGHYLETRFNALRIADDTTNRRYHLARARWLSQLQGVLDQNLSCLGLPTRQERS